MSKTIREIVGDINDIDQMYNARDLLDEKIKKHNNQERFLVWEVSDGWNLTVEYFKGEDYLLAVDFMAKKGFELSKDSRKEPKDKTLKIQPFYWLESQYNGYFN